MNIAIVCTNVTYECPVNNTAENTYIAHYHPNDNTVVYSHVAHYCPINNALVYWHVAHDSENRYSVVYKHMFFTDDWEINHQKKKKKKKPNQTNKQQQQQKNPKTNKQTNKQIAETCVSRDCPVNPIFDALRRQTWPSPADAHRGLWGPVETLRQTVDFALLTGLMI